MMERILLCTLCVLFLHLSLASAGEKPERGLFVSMIEDPMVLSDRKEIRQLVDFAKRAKVRTLYVQIYRANKTWFPSKVGDPSLYVESLKSVGEDPLALLIKQSHAQGIKVHAWLNMLSLSTNRNAPLLKKYGPGILTRNLDPKKSLGDYMIDHQFFLEPGDLRVRAELSELLGEILRAYPAIDGIMFDYIRYPDVNPAYGYTKQNVARFKEASKRKTIDEEGEDWKGWKRGQVTELLSALVKKTRALHPGIQVSATGCMPYGRALYEAFQDWPKWVNSGLVDFVTVMDYSPDPVEFERWVKAVMPEVKEPGKINIAIGVYKPETTPDTFARELRFCEGSGNGGCTVFYYGCFAKNLALAHVLAGEKKIVPVVRNGRKQ